MNRCVAFSGAVLLALSSVASDTRGDAVSDLYAGAGTVRPGAIAPYPYEARLIVGAGVGTRDLYHFTGLDIRPPVVHVEIRSTERVSTTIGSRPVLGSMQAGDGTVDISIMRFAPPKPAPERVEVETYRTVPYNLFSIPLRGMWIPEQRPAYIRLRFRGRDEILSLSFDADGRLALGAYDAEFVTLTGSVASNAGCARARFEGITYTCSTLGMFAEQDSKMLWRSPVAMEGRPLAITRVDGLLFVRGTPLGLGAAHTMYVQPEDGKAIYYTRSPLSGDDAVEDLLRCAEDIRRRERDGASGVMVAREPLIRALGGLSDVRAVPFLIECVEAARGVGERALASAALSRIKGDDAAWHDAAVAMHLRAESSPFNRLLDDLVDVEASAAAAATWRNAFADALSP